MGISTPGQSHQPWLMAACGCRERGRERRRGRGRGAGARPREIARDRRTAAQRGLLVVAGGARRSRDPKAGVLAAALFRGLARSRGRSSRGGFGPWTSFAAQPAGAGGCSSKSWSPGPSSRSWPTCSWTPQVRAPPPPGGHPTADHRSHVCPTGSPPSASRSRAGITLPPPGHGGRGTAAGRLLEAGSCVIG